MKSHMNVSVNKAQQSRVNNFDPGLSAFLILKTCSQSMRISLKKKQQLQTNSFDFGFV